MTNTAKNIKKVLNTISEDNVYDYLLNNSAEAEETYYDIVSFVDNYEAVYPVKELASLYNEYAWDAFDELCAKADTTYDAFDTYMEAIKTIILIEQTMQYMKGEN